MRSTRWLFLFFFIGERRKLCEATILLVSTKAAPNSAPNTGSPRLTNLLFKSDKSDSLKTTYRTSTLRMLKNWKRSEVSILGADHSRPQRPRSFWSAPRIEHQETRKLATFSSFKTSLWKSIFN